ncbi:unnamed protein product [Protopolystoma xenopodis]|uniref:Uncharacterized protein n=1 Tax=Protopolystoma xenopodis TaxID=117903 RepID=A0A3S5AF06_9PLAT|nr:unnamed protein product [Protopolystoma xenopodis]
MAPSAFSSFACSQQPSFIQTCIEPIVPFKPSAPSSTALSSCNTLKPTSDSLQTSLTLKQPDITPTQLISIPPISIESSSSVKESATSDFGSIWREDASRLNISLDNLGKGFAAMELRPTLNMLQQQSKNSGLSFSPDAGTRKKDLSGNFAILFYNPLFIYAN